MAFIFWGVICFSCNSCIKVMYWRSDSLYLNFSFCNKAFVHEPLFLKGSYHVVPGNIMT